MISDKKVYRAGTIPYFVEDGVIKMMFMRPSDSEYGGDEFQLAKGKVEDDEDFKTAALREAKEELGLFLGNIYHTELAGTFMGRTTVYVAKIIDQRMFGEPSFETAETKWLTLDEFMEIGRPLHRPVVASCYQTILDLEKHGIYDPTR